jgi:hypothetical protein
MILFWCPGMRYDRTPGHRYAGQLPNHTFFWWKGMIIILEPKSYAYGQGLKRMRKGRMHIPDLSLLKIYCC